MSRKRESRPGDKNYNYRHGHSNEGGRTREYSAWASMKQRCTNERGEKFKHYGGRGISFYPPWENFANFLSDMGPAPDQKATLERLDVNKDYGPENCVWAPWSDQHRNKRNTIRITANGVTKSVQSWAESTGLARACIVKRLGMGWSDQDAVTTPSDLRRPRRPNKRTRWVDIDGVSRPLADWARELGVSSMCLSWRIKSGWYEKK